jgi:hypothetical protein
LAEWRLLGDVSARAPRSFNAEASERSALADLPSQATCALLAAGHSCT